MTTTKKLRRDAGASVFAYAVAGVALLVHVIASVRGRWSADEVALEVTGGPGDGVETLHVDTAAAPGWAVATLRVAEAAEWLLGAAVLVVLTVCVVRMIRGEVFSRSTARWATAAGWATLALLILPGVLRLGATNAALQSTPDPQRWDTSLVSTEWWYLYVGMMTLSFLALVLRRGAQLQEDQEGLI